MDHMGGWWILFFVIPFWFMRPRYWRRRSRDWDDDDRGASRERERNLDRLDQAVRARLELIDQLDSRVAELENRLDFTERLLAQRMQDPVTPSRVVAP